MAGNILVITSNKKAFHDYHILEKMEAGIVLRGTEVKSLRDGRANLKDSYARIIKGEIFLMGMHIGQYRNEGYVTHDPEQPRKLLMHKDEIRRLHRKVMEKGVTLIPLRAYFKRGRAKIEIGMATGKKQYDKRADIAKREQHREMKRMEKNFQIK